MAVLLFCSLYGPMLQIIVGNDLRGAEIAKAVQVVYDDLSPPGGEDPILLQNRKIFVGVGLVQPDETPESCLGNGKVEALAIPPAVGSVPAQGVKAIAELFNAGIEALITAVEEQKIHGLPGQIHHHGE